MVITTAAIMSITRTKGLVRRGLVVAAFGVVGLALAVTAGARLAGDFQEVDAAALRATLQDDSTHVSDAELARFIDARVASAKAHPSRDVYDDLALAALERIKRAGRTARPEDFTQAIEWQRQALVRSPADAYGWTRLAYLLVQSGGATEAVAQAIGHALATAPYEPRLMVPRLALAMLLRDHLSAESWALLPEMFRAAWATEPTALTHAAKIGFFTSDVREALSVQPDALNAFESLLQHAP